MAQFNNKFRDLVFVELKLGLDRCFHPAEYYLFLKISSLTQYPTYLQARSHYIKICNNSTACLQSPCPILKNKLFHTLYYFNGEIAHQTHSVKAILRTSYYKRRMRIHKVSQGKMMALSSKIVQPSEQHSLTARKKAKRYDTEFSDRLSNLNHRMFQSFIPNLRIKTSSNQKGNRESILAAILKGGERSKQQFIKSLISRSKLQSDSVQVCRSKQFRISKFQKQNIKQIIRSSVCQPLVPKNRLSEQNKKLLRSSFNKKIKQIRMRKYVTCKDEENQIIKSKLDACGGSLIGMKHQQNQDAWIMSEGIYIVCDGHGSNGKQIAQFVSKTALSFFQSAFLQHKVDINSIKTALRKTEDELQQSGMDISFSGCTFVGVLCYDHSIYCISIGDSRAIICEGFLTNPISALHKPDQPIERARIEAMGGVIRPLQISKDKFSGPDRIWAPGKNSWGPGLALSRAFGDKAARKYGVISQPQITTLQLSFDEQYIVLGSDGLFEAMKDQQISYFIRRHLKEETILRQEIGQALVEEASRAAGVDSDDITCIIIFL